VKNRRILIIEDDRDVREALAEAVTEAGVRADIAEDGIVGLERLRAGPRPSVILLDMRMPRLGGEAFLKQLRDDPEYESVPVITMTAGIDIPDRSAVVAHLRKPFDLEDLLGIVLSLCEEAEPASTP
jgi:CheY-like chemotaxis protein